MAAKICPQLGTGGAWGREQEWGGEICRVLTAETHNAVPTVLLVRPHASPRHTDAKGKLFPLGSGFLVKLAPQLGLQD